MDHRFLDFRQEGIGRHVVEVDNLFGHGCCSFLAAVILDDIESATRARGLAFGQLGVAVWAITLLALAMLVLFLADRLSRRDPGFPVFVILDGKLKGVSPEIGTMKLVFGKAFQGIGHIFVGYFSRLIQGFAFGEFCEHTRYRDGRATAEGLKLNVLNAIIFDLQMDGHHISAERIAHLADAVRAFYGAHIPGLSKVIHHCF
jgi:hypothetical protein